MFTSRSDHGIIEVRSVWGRKFLEGCSLHIDDSNSNAEQVRGYLDDLKKGERIGEMAWDWLLDMRKGSTASCVFSNYVYLSGSPYLRGLRSTY